MNKKGVVIGKTIATIVTLIVVTFIMAVFVIVSIGVSALKKPEIEKGKIFSQGQNDLLVQNVLVEMNNDQQQMLAYDATVLYLKNQISREALVNSLKLLLNENKNCLFFLDEDQGFPSIYRFQEGSAKEKNSNLELFSSVSKSYDFDIDGKSTRIYYYYGHCPSRLE